MEDGEFVSSVIEFPGPRVILFRGCTVLVSDRWIGGLIKLEWTGNALRFVSNLIKKQSGTDVGATSLL